MNPTAPSTAGAAPERWPVGWPLPLTAVAPSLRWEEVVEFYLAFVETEWGPAVAPDPGEPRMQPPRRRAA